MHTPDLSFLPEDISALVTPLFFGRPRACALDCDGTLGRFDVGEDTLRILDRDRRLPAAPRGDAWAQFQKLHQMDGGVDVSYLFATFALAGVPEAELEAVGQGIATGLVREQRYFTPMTRLVRALRETGQQVWVVSASNIWAVRYAAGVLGIPKERIIGVELTYDESGKARSVKEPAPIGKGKAEVLAARNIRPALAAGNSIHDEAMLKAAERAFVVIQKAKPDQPAIEMAKSNSWPILYV